MLDQAKDMRNTDQSALMTDAQTLQATRRKPALVAALQADPANADLARILEAWNCRDHKDLAVPLIYHSLPERLVCETYVDELGDKLARDWLGPWYAWQTRFDELVKAPDSPWFDAIRRPPKESLPDLVRRVAAAVRSELQVGHDAGPAKWKSAAAGGGGSHRTGLLRTRWS